MSAPGQLESPEARVYAAGFARCAHLWAAPDSGRLLGQADAIAALDCGEFPPQFTMTVPDTGIRALSDEMVEKLFAPAADPPWLHRLAELVAEKLTPAICAEVRKGRRS